MRECLSHDLTTGTPDCTLPLAPNEDTMNMCVWPCAPESVRGTPPPQWFLCVPEMSPALVKLKSRVVVGVDYFHSIVQADVLSLSG